MKVVLAQFNATVGDLAGNARRVAQMARQAHAEGARLVVTPELAAFIARCEEAVQEVTRSTAG